MSFASISAPGVLANEKPPQLRLKWLLLLSLLFGFLATTVAAADEYADTSQPGWWNDPKESCVELRIEALYSTPLEFDGYHFCTDGIVRVGGYDDEVIIYLVPPGYTPWDMGMRAMAIRSEELEPEILALNDDDEVRIEGFLSVDRRCNGGMRAVPYQANEEDYPTVCYNYVEDLFADVGSLEVMGSAPGDPACIEINIDELYERPYDFDGKSVCFDARIAVEYEGMELFPIDWDVLAAENRYENDLPFGIDPGLNAFATERRGIRTGDLDHVQGRIGIDANCLPPNWRLSALETFCIPNRPIWVTQSEVTLLEHIPARERCIQISLEAVYADPELYAGKMFCTEGTTHFQDQDIYLLPDELQLSQDIDYLMDFSPWHFQEYFPTLPGQRTSVAGVYSIWDGCLTGYSLPYEVYADQPQPDCPTALSLELYDIEYLTDVDPWVDCREIDITALYEDPMVYDSQVICGVGHFNTELVEVGYYQHILTPDGTIPDVPLTGPIVTWLPASDAVPDTPFTGPDAHVRFVGYFDADNECFVEGQLALENGTLTQEQYAETRLRYNAATLNIAFAVYLD